MLVMVVVKAGMAALKSVVTVVVKELVFLMVMMPVVAKVMPVALVVVAKLVVAKLVVIPVVVALMPGDWCGLCVLMVVFGDADGGGVC